MRKYELTSLDGLTYQCWLATRWEQKRFADLIRAWKKQNPKATVIQEMLVESLVRCHVWEQRLVDRRLFFDGERTDYKQVADRDVDISTDDLNRKSREFKEMMPLIQRWKTDLLKLALANNVSLNINGDIRNVSSLFGALDETELGKLETYRDNGSRNAENRI